MNEVKNKIRVRLEELLAQISEEEIVGFALVVCANEAQCSGWNGSPRDLLSAFEILKFDILSENTTRQHLPIGEYNGTN